MTRLFLFGIFPKNRIVIKISFVLLTSFSLCINTNAQKLSNIIKTSLYEYEQYVNDDMYLEVFCYDRTNQATIWNIDSLYEHDSGIKVCHFRTLLPHEFSHLLIIDNKRYIIVNMRKPLDKVLSEVFDFFKNSNESQISPQILTQIISLHYDDRYVELYDRDL